MDTKPSSQLHSMALLTGIATHSRNAKAGLTSDHGERQAAVDLRAAQGSTQGDPIMRSISVHLTSDIAHDR